MVSIRVVSVSIFMCVSALSLASVPVRKTTSSDISIKYLKKFADIRKVEDILSAIPGFQRLNLYGRNLAILLDSFGQEIFEGQHIVSERLSFLLAAKSSLIIVSQTLWYALKNHYASQPSDLSALLDQWDVFSYQNSYFLCIPKDFNATQKTGCASLGINLENFEVVRQDALLPAPNEDPASLSQRFLRFVELNARVLSFRSSATIIDLLKSLIVNKNHDALAQLYPWTFFLDGHGGRGIASHIICDLNTYDFKKLLQIIQMHAATKFFMYCTCHSGLRETLIDMFQENNESLIYDFPIMCWGFGDVLTRGGSNFDTFFRNLRLLNITPRNADELFWAAAEFKGTSGYSPALSRNQGMKSLLPEDNHYKGNDNDFRPQIRWAHQNKFELLVPKLNANIKFASDINKTKDALPEYVAFGAATECLLDVPILHKPLLCASPQILPHRAQFNSMYPGDSVHYINQLTLPNVVGAKNVLGCFTGLSMWADKKIILIALLNYGDHPYKQAKNIMIFNHSIPFDRLKTNPKLIMYYELDECSYLAYVDEVDKNGLMFDRSRKCFPAIKTKVLVPREAVYFKQLFIEHKDRLGA